MTGKTIFTALTALSLTAVPVAAQAAPAAAFATAANPARGLSLGPSVRAGSRSKGEHITQAGWIIGVGMIALGAGAIVLAVDDNNNNDNRPSSN